MANAKQIGLALYNFDQDYGKYPDATTAAAVRLKSGSTLSLPDRTSNDLFAQLFAAGILDSERSFYAKCESSRKPDNVFHNDATLLEHGECAFAYIAGLSSLDDPSAPLLFGPVIPGTTTLDLKSCDGKAIVYRLDNSAVVEKIDSKGKIIINGIDLLDPRQPYWHGKRPDVKWPK